MDYHAHGPRLGPRLCQPLHHSQTQKLKHHGLKKAVKLEWVLKIDHCAQPSTNITPTPPD